MGGRENEKVTIWLQNVAIKKIPVRNPVFIPKGWAIAYCLGHRPMAVGAALASCGFQHHPPAVRFIYRAPRLRAVGVMGVGLTDSRGSALFLGLPTPRPVCDLIIPHNRQLVKHFFIFFKIFWSRWGKKENYLSPFSSAHCWYSSIASHSASWTSQYSDVI